MIPRRFEVRPIASRRLRAALLLVFLLGLIGIGQTRLSSVALVVAVLALSAIFADGWRRTRVPACHLILNYRPLNACVIDPANDVHEAMALRCVRASVYPWLIVLQFEKNPQTTGFLPTWLRRAVVLLPDSLSKSSRDDWRRLLVWARLMRRQLANR